MRLPLKAALLSALVLPGAGYFVLGKPGRALVVAGLSLLGLQYLVMGLLEKVMPLAAQVMAGQLSLDPQSIEAAALAADARVDISSTLILWVFLALWLFCVVDAWRLGRIEERRRVGE